LLEILKIHIYKYFFQKHHQFYKFLFKKSGPW
jgi:hypothetical protein